MVIMVFRLVSPKLVKLSLMQLLGDALDSGKFSYLFESFTY